MSYKGINFKDINKNIPYKKMNFLEFYIKKIGNVRIIFTIFTLLIIFLVGIILPKSAKADGGVDYKNYFYVNVINNALSVMSSSKTKNEYSNSDQNMKLAALSFLGVDILNPISIIVKEVSYLNKSEVKTNENNVSNLKTYILNPFKLVDDQISKIVAQGEVSNVKDIYDPALKTTLNKAKPRVLIYHSHTSEAYLTSDKDTTKTNSSLDDTRNVTAVGDVIKEELEKNYGIAVVHDKTVNDKGDYKAAYKKSGVTLGKYLKAYEKFELIIDLHRDEVPNKNAVTTKINGVNVAQFMFVVTQKNPRYAKQRKLIDSMIGISNKIYPNLIRPKSIFVYDYGMGYYNQDKSDNAVLIEIGANSNTIQEVKNTGKYLSRIIAEQLNGKKWIIYFKKCILSNKKIIISNCYL